MKLSSFLISIGAIAHAFTTTLAREQQQQASFRRSNTHSNEHQDYSMKTRELEPGLFSIYVASPADYSDAETRRLQPQSQDFRSCILYLEDVYYSAEDSKNVEEKWVCTFENYVDKNGGNPFPYTFDLPGDVDKSEAFMKAEVLSGRHILRWDVPEAVTLHETDNTLTLNIDILNDRNILWIEAIDSGLIEDEEQDEDEEANERKLQFLARAEGVKKTLVIRVVGDGVGPKASLNDLKQEVFGNGISLKSRMEKCSHGKLDIQPFSGTTSGGAFNQKIDGGVVELGISTNPYGKRDKRMENDVMQAAFYVFGNLNAQFDLVLISMPPGIFPNFAAYAYIGTPYSFYSNENIRDTMIQMHEVGHNFGLQHAGQDQEEYGDASGYMGYSETKEPRMCYNAVNNYQLGWYSNISINPTSVDGYGGTFFISGVAGYDPDDTTKYVTLRLEQITSSMDYYIGYNRAEGMNSETKEDGDKVIVFTKNGDIHESKLSWKVASLHVGDSHVIDNYDNSGRFVTITFSNIDDSNAAVVEITPEFSESPTSSPRPSPSPTATTSPSASPSAGPTATHSASPTDTPTATPTTVESYCDDELFLKIDILTDNYPEETGWKLKKVGGEAIATVDPLIYDKKQTNFTHPFCLEYDTCYRFKIYDTAEGTYFRFSFDMTETG